MPRGNFNETTKVGGAGFQEGRVLVHEAYSTIYQFPPNSQTGVQSEAFCAQVWKAYRLNDAGKIVTAKEADGEEGPVEVEIVHRMASKNDNGVLQIRPGRLDPKDFDDLTVDATDLGTELGVKGNAFFLEESELKFGAAWTYIKDSMEKKAGFKPEIMGRGITTDFVGMDAHFKQEEGAKYIAKKGKDKGKEVTPSNLVCTKIYMYPYDKNAKDNLAKLVKEAGGSGGVASGAGGASSSAAGGKPNGAAAAGGTGSDEETRNAALKIAKAFTPEFKAAMSAGKDKAISREEFNKALAKELMRQAPKAKADLLGLTMTPALQKSITAVFKSDDGLIWLATETGGEVFMLDDVDKPTALTFA